jgi:hypothetical protein
MLAWLKAVPAMQDRVLVLSYEELVGDLPSQLRRLAAFLALPALSDSDLQGLVANLSFSGMKADAAKYNPISVAWKDPANAFLRKGVVGDSASAWIEGGPALQQLYEDLLVSDVRRAAGAGATGAGAESDLSDQREADAEEPLSESGRRLLLSLI